MLIKSKKQLIKQLVDFFRRFFFVRKRPLILIKVIIKINLLGIARKIAQANMKYYLGLI